MAAHILSAYLAMIFTSNVWVVYGIGLDKWNRDVFCEDCDITSTKAALGASNTSPYTQPSGVSAFSLLSAPPSITETTHAASTSDTTPRETPHLSTGALVGIGAGIGVVFLAVLLNLIGVCYLRQRREHALRRAVEEVERGVQLKRVVGNESEERVGVNGKEIILSEGSELYNDGRKGMSLPRRFY